MNSLDDDRLVAPDRSQPFAELLVPAHEIKARQVHGFAGQKVVHVAVEKSDVYRTQILVIAFAVLVKRRILAFHEVIVRPQVQRRQAVDSQLYAEPAGEGRLS